MVLLDESGDSPSHDSALAIDNISIKGDPVETIVIQTVDENVLTGANLLTGQVDYQGVDKNTIVSAVSFQLADEAAAQTYALQLQSLGFEAAQDGAVVTVEIGESVSGLPTPLGGTLEMTAAGAFEYQAPDLGDDDTGTPIAQAVEEITYQIMDGDGDTSEAMLTINIVNDPQDDGGEALNLIVGSSDADVAEAAALTGTAGHDLVIGGAGDDALLGLAGDDTLVGGDGADVLSGGAGEDVLIGGASLADPYDGQSDRFIFAALEDAGDVIHGFDVAAPESGGDLLDISDLLSSTGSSPSDIVFESTNGGADTEVKLDADGDGSAEVLVASLIGVSANTAFADLADNMVLAA